MEFEKAAAYVLRDETMRAFPWGDAFDAAAGDVSFLGCRGMGSGPLEWMEDATQKGERYLRGGILLPERHEEQARTTWRYWRRPIWQSRRFSLRCVKDVE